MKNKQKKLYKNVEFEDDDDDEGNENNYWEDFTIEHEIQDRLEGDLFKED